ncbi:kinase-like domain-containing protein [Rhizophagus clarus]|uniref:Kinase-like domain-containing protein n=2 Tax=Rhizophagus clarus TaxID=94130 RepID=A0A8H3QKL1_9GLOM|nr:kinase-like domain-containing protein [Rhizophagus clarus]
MSLQDIKDNEEVHSKNFASWTSGNGQIDDFIQEMQLKSKNLVFEWIPYSQFNRIKETGKNEYMTVYSAIWKDGPLRKCWSNYYRSNYYTRDSYKQVALKYLHNLQDPIESLINEAKKYLTSSSIYSAIWKDGPLTYNREISDYTRDSNKVVALKYLHNSQDPIESSINEVKSSSSKIQIFGISQNPDTNGYILRNRYSNKQVALKYLHNSQDPIESLINEAKKYLTSSSMVALKYLHNSQDPIESLINEVKSSSSKIQIFGISQNPESSSSKIQIFGISQNPDTNGYILVQNNIIWASGNKKIDDFIQEMQMKANKLVFEWIPYSQLNEIKETGKNSFMTVYSAIWKDGPLYFVDYGNNDYIRYSNEQVALKCLYNLQDPIETIINEAKKYLTNSSIYSAIWKDGPLTYDDWKEDVYSRDANEQVALKYLNYSQDPIESIINEAKKYLTNSINEIQIYGISQNSDTNDYILVQNKLINLINWTIYSAIWKDGPLHYNDDDYDDCIRDSNKQVALKCLRNSQDPIESLINEVKKYLTSSSVYSAIWKDGPLYKNHSSTRVSNKQVALKFLHNSQDQIESLINEVKKYLTSSSIYSAIWKDGPLTYDWEENGYTRDANEQVALKYLNYSQDPIESIMNEIKAYSTKAVNYTSGIIKVYGISQDPVTQNYVIVLQYAEGGNFNNWINVNENYKNFNWENKMQTLCYIANGLKEIHEKQMVHRDFHTGNILLISPFFQDAANRTYISDMGLCGKIGSINQNNIYGVMPYVAPEVLRGKPYTQVADIYSFGMIMYFVATGRQPFDNCAHDHNLVLDICNGVRPEISELEAPKSYIDLMKSCWNSNPENRPNVIKLYKLLRSINTSKKSEIKEAENYRKLHLSSLKGDRQITTHPQAIYTSRLLNPFTEDLDSKCLDCAVND